MITINTEKGLLKVEDWPSILERPGFLKDLDPKQHTLKSIIGRYVFADEVHCGLSSCHTPHKRGYIVTTESGQETNIGKDCGKNYFGVDFELLAKQFDRDITEKENRETLWNFTFQIEELEAKLTTLRSGNQGADWVYKKSIDLIEPNTRVPHVVVRQMTNLAKTKGDLITTQREASQKEIEAQEVIQGRKIKERPYYISEPLARISGVETLYPENNLKELLITGIEEQLKAFKVLKIDGLSFEKLAFWKKWVTSVDLKLETAEATIKSGKALLTYPNLSPLLKLLEEDRDKEVFQRYLDSLKAT